MSKTPHLLRKKESGKISILTGSSTKAIIGGFPKDGYYAYKAAWTEEAVVHIFPHWNWPGKEGDTLDVQSYTNCDAVGLLLNGKSLGKQIAVPFKKLHWPVIYQPGKLEVKSNKAGKVVTRDIVETTSDPAKIALNSDVNTLKADGCDVAVIRVSIQDAEDRTVPVANNLIKFSLNGPGRIIGTGNGNPSNHEPDKTGQRLAFNGYCLVLVQSDKTAGEISLTASSTVLGTAELHVKVE